jgi:dipeptidyl-peptidase 4
MKQKTKKLAIMTKVLLLLMALISGITGAHAQASSKSQKPVEVPVETVERLRAIFEGGEFSSVAFRGNWLPDGSGYLVLERSPGSDRQALVSYNAESGLRKELINSSQLVLSGFSGQVTIEDYTFSPDGSRILLDASVRENGKTVSHYWMLDNKIR